jgi:hypothetical protein
MKERRDNSRIDLTGELTYEVCSSIESNEVEDRQKCNGTVVNVSGSGLCLDTQDAIKDTQILKINIPIPGMDVQIPTLAMVMWKQAHNGGSRVGLMYVI